jgi:hypothetical protein
MNCVPGHMQCNYRSAYPAFSIQLNVSALLLQISRECYARYTANLVPHTAHILQFTLCELWSRHIQSTYISAYLGFDIQQKVAPLLLKVSRQFRARYTSNLVPNTAHILQFTQCVLWCRKYTIYLQLLIFR